MIEVMISDVVTQYFAPESGIIVREYDLPLKILPIVWIVCERFWFGSGGEIGTAMIPA